MSELRTQLDQARRDHLAARYPGDLAADLLHTPPTRLTYATPARRHWLFWTNVGVLGAVAASLVLVFWYLRLTASVVLNPGNGGSLEYITTWPPPADHRSSTDQFSIVPQLAGTSLTPQGGDVVPSTATAVSFPAVPSFPSLTDVLNATATPDTTDNDTNQNNQPSYKETT